MKNIIVIFAALLLSFTSFGWGQIGHRATGKIAERYLTKKARKQIERILGQESLAMSSTWMDEIRSDSTYDYTSDWHWVTIPDGMTYEQSEKNPKGDVIEAIERIVKALKSKTLTANQEKEYLKMLVHLVGDIHQPLHVGRGNDKGGNDVKIMWFRVDSNLHRVWDSDMINDKQLSFTELAESLGKPAPAEVKAWQRATVREWAQESISYRNDVYDYGQGRLGYRYAYLYFHIVEKRLLQAGIRLAGVLNEIYG